MPGIILGIEVENRTALGGKLRAELRRVQKEMMLEVGREFAREHVAPHFGPANRGRFDHEKRNDVYLKEIKPAHGSGQGKYVDLQLTGRSKRQVLATVRVTAVSDRVTVRATVPAYFSKPFIGSFAKQVTTAAGKVRQVFKRVTRQPDKMKELGAIDDKDRASLQKFAVKIGRRLWNQAKAAVKKKVV